MRLTPLTAGAGTMLATAIAALGQSPTLFYDFNSGTGGTASGAATVNTPPVAVGSFSAGNVLQLDGNDNSFVQTGIQASTLGFTSANYTASAWVYLTSTAGDGMVFGQQNAPYLHEGVRDGKVHLGHYGADSTGPTTLAANTWYHLTWRVEGGKQTLFIGGNYDTLPTAQGLLSNTENVQIGSAAGGGGLPGFLDDVVVYNSALTRSQIAALASGANPNAVPAAVATGQGLIGGAISGNEGSNLAYTQSNTWGVKAVANNGGMGNIFNAVASLRSGAGTVTNGSVPIISEIDPQNANTSGHLVNARHPYIGDTAGDDENMAWIYKSKITVPAGQGGDFTFGVHSDDGFALRIGNKIWTNVSGAGGVDFDDKSVLYFGVGTGNSDTRGVINLPAGTYDVDFITFEGGGGSGHELVYAPGVHTSDATAGWRAVGDTDGVKNMPSVTAAGWTVTTSAAGGSEITNLAQAAADLLATGTTVTGVASINYADPGGSATANAGQVGGDIPFANDVALQDEEDFGVRATAMLTIDSPDTYRFGFHSDDGGYMKITGQTGWTNLQTAVGAVISGDSVIADALTGDANTFADIFLAPGTYLIEAGFFERGGGANWELLAGDASFGNFNLQLLAAGSPTSTTVNSVFLGVPEPSTFGLMFLAAAGMLRRRR